MDSDRSGQNTPLDSQQRAELAKLTERFRSLGAPDPEEWAESEVRENFAQLARFCFLRSFWSSEIDSWLDTRWIDNFVSAAARRPDEPFADAGRALQRLQEAGAQREDIARVARFAAYSAVFAVLERIDEGCDPEIDEDCPNWRLMEVAPNGQLTGRALDSLHESILTLDPSGRDGHPNDLSSGRETTSD